MEQPGLADTGLAGHQQHLAGAVSRSRQAALGNSEQVVPAMHCPSADPRHDSPTDIRGQACPT
jgi:hypothetical protein